MFINISKFKSYLKKAYKSVLGVNIERTKDDIIVINVGGLYIEADMQEATKEFKAAIIEVCGEIPHRGVARTYNEDGDQEAIPSFVNRELFKTDYMQGKGFEESRLTLDGCILFQAEMGTEEGRQILPIPGKLLDIYAPSKTTVEEEDPSEWVRLDDLLVCGNPTMILGLRPEPLQYQGEALIVNALQGTSIIYTKFEGDRL